MRRFILTRLGNQNFAQQCTQTQTADQQIRPLQPSQRLAKTNLVLTPSAVSFVYPGSRKQVLTHQPHKMVVDGIASFFDVSFQNFNHHLLDAFRLKEPEQNRLDQ